MSEQTQATGDAGRKERETPMEKMKSNLVEALAKSRSVLQNDRPEGEIYYPVNHQTNMVYNSWNALQLAQKIHDSKAKTPEFLTQDQISAKGYNVAKGAQGVLITEYHNQLHQKIDKFPVKLGPDGQPMLDASGKPIYDKTQPPISRKGDPVLKDGKPIGGNVPAFAFLISDVDSRERRFVNTGNRKTDGTFLFKPIYGDTPTIVVDPEKKYQNPFRFTDREGKTVITAKPGDFYKAADNSPVEKLLEAASKYFNSMYTGAKYQATTFTNDEIAALRAEIKNPNSRLVPGMNDAFYIATGQNEKAQRIANQREENKKAELEGRPPKPMPSAREFHKEQTRAQAESPAQGRKGRH